MLNMLSGLVLLMLLASCGIKGPLVLPPEKPIDESKVSN